MLWCKAQTHTVCAMIKLSTQEARAKKEEYHPTSTSTSTWMPMPCTLLYCTVSAKLLSF